MNAIAPNIQVTAQAAQTLEIQDDRREHRAPNFTLPASSGEDVTLYKFAGRKRVILFFPISAEDATSREYARKICGARAAWNDVDATVLPLLNAELDTVRAWSQENAQGYASLADLAGSIRKRYYSYFEVEPAQALVVLLNIYCTPLVISHGTDANALIPPEEIEKWLNMIACACSE